MWGTCDVYVKTNVNTLILLNWASFDFDSIRFESKSF
jgi:hypothetical protein